MPKVKKNESRVTLTTWSAGSERVSFCATNVSAFEANDDTSQAKLLSGASGAGYIVA